MIRIYRLLFPLFLCLQAQGGLFAQQLVFEKNAHGRFPLVDGGASPLLYDGEEAGIVLAVENLAGDIAKVTGKQPKILSGVPNAQHLVLIGQWGESALIDQLAAAGKLEVADLNGAWENFAIQRVERPMDGVEEALVIVGSDKRGTLFGIYELAAQIGVSPWNWWADVPVQEKESLFVVGNRYSPGAPKVKYRGIFINDEAPALAGWADKTFGGFNSQFYEKVFELILRLKGNYLWPAMWGKAFYDDDPKNAPLAKKYGIVIGTTHHEPLMRAHVEWSRYGEGAWNYQTNKETLQQFWREGMERVGEGEEITVSLGMRGDGDEPMSEESNIALLEKIINDQRQIIEEVTGKPSRKTPQFWALYKEVQEYYDMGMDVPDDVMLLLCDDNWGNVRKLPEMGSQPRAGGYGMYYHFDYVGGPRNYKWLNTNPLPRIWEQMHLTYRHGVDELWVVNVGDIKPMEFPISFFLDYAWDPDALPATSIMDYTSDWAAQQFGGQYAPEIAELLVGYAKINGRRKPELLDQHTYALYAENEAARVQAEWDALVEKTVAIKKLLAPAYHDAYFQLVEFPILACANLNELYYTVALNHVYAAQGHSGTNAMAEKARKLYEKDSLLSHAYNHELAAGKWVHMMDQTHIGYTYWQQPETNVMPEVKTIDVPNQGRLGVEISATGAYYPDQKQLEFPESTPFQAHKPTLALFNRGKKAISYTITSNVDWLKVNGETGEVEDAKQVALSVDWEKAPAGKNTAKLTVRSGKDRVEVLVPVHNFQVEEGFAGFVESNGFLSIEAPHYTSKKEIAPVKWQEIPDLGRTGSALTAFPVSYRLEDAEKPQNYVEYNAYFTSSGEVTIHTYLSPTLNFRNLEEGLRFAISIDDQAPQVISMNKKQDGAIWNQWAANNINVQQSKHTLDRPGEHTIKLWLIDPAVVVQKIVVDTGGLQKTYLGPPESKVVKAKRE